MSIADNKKAFDDYFIEEKFEAGLVLEGWEVKAIRAGRVQLKEAYVVVKNGAVYLIGCHISPLPTASTHIHPDPTRSRKLLLHASEINKLIGKTERAGFTLVPLNMHFSKGRINSTSAWPKGKNSTTNAQLRRIASGSAKSSVWSERTKPEMWRRTD